MDSSLLCYYALLSISILQGQRVDLSREGDNEDLLSDCCANTLHTTPLLQVSHTNLTEVKQTTDLSRPCLPRKGYPLIRECSV